MVSLQQISKWSKTSSAGTVWSISWLSKPAIHIHWWEKNHLSFWLIYQGSRIWGHTKSAAGSMERDWDWAMVAIRLRSWAHRILNQLVAQSTDSRSLRNWNEERKHFFKIIESEKLRLHRRRREAKRNGWFKNRRQGKYSVGGQESLKPTQQQGKESINAVSWIKIGKEQGLGPCVWCLRKEKEIARAEIGEG